MPPHSAQAALEVRLHHRLARVGPEALLAAVGEQPGQGDQTEVGVQQLEGVVTAVVDDDIAGGERPEVGQGRQALVAMGEQVEIDRDAGAQLVEAAEQALRVVGVR